MTTTTTTAETRRNLRKLTSKILNKPNRCSFMRLGKIRGRGDTERGARKGGGSGGMAELSTKVG